MVLNIANINSFISTQLNGFKHHYLKLTTQFRNTVKEFQVLLINTNNSIQHYSFVNTQLQELLCITNNSIKHQSFVYTQLNGQTVLFLTIQFNVNHLLARSSNDNSSIWPIDRTLSGVTTPGQSGPRSDNNEGILFTQPLCSGRIWHKVNF